MSEFINTIDILGDDAVIDSIIEGSITEFRDDEITIIGDYAFYKNPNLVTIDVPNVTTICHSAFETCSALLDINAPNVANLNGASIFNSCTSLSNISFPMLKFLHVSAEGLFSNCSNLSSVDMPQIIELPNSTFRGCSSLKNIRLPALKRTYNYVFAGSGLVALILPNSSSVCIMNTSNALSDTPIASGTGYIYVPSALVDSYKTANNWSTYASQIRAIEDYSIDGTVNGAIYAVANNLMHVTNSNTNATSLSSYSATISPTDGFSLDNLVITMDGADITSSAYDGNGNINIPTVTGTICITASAILDIGSEYRLTPYDGSEEGKFPVFKLNVQAGQVFEITYYFTQSTNGYIYDGRACGSRFDMGGTLNAETTTSVTIVSDGVMYFNDYHGNYSKNGALSTSGKYGKYIIVKRVK